MTKDERTKRTIMAHQIGSLRVFNELTQHEMAQKLGIVQGSYSALEHGHRHIKRPWLKVLAKAFGVPVETLTHPGGVDCTDAIWEVLQAKRVPQPIDKRRVQLWAGRVNKGHTMTDIARDAGLSRQRVSKALQDYYHVTLTAR